MGCSRIFPEVYYPVKSRRRKSASIAIVTSGEQVLCKICR
jgi:hypothetical protein